MSDKSPQADHDRAAVERSVQSCYATWAQTYFDQYYRAEGAYPPVHRAIVRDLLVAAGVRRLIDAGCGPASMLRTLADLGMALHGFDLTAEMVAEARRVMMALGTPAEHVWQASVLDADAYRSPDGQPFDAAICIGVLPHVRPGDDDTVLTRLREAVPPGGLVIVEARNQLFSLFTLNRYSRDFFLYELIRPGARQMPRRAAASMPRWPSSIGVSASTSRRSAAASRVSPATTRCCRAPAIRWCSGSA